MTLFAKLTYSIFGKKNSIFFGVTTGTMMMVFLNTNIHVTPFSEGDRVGDRVSGKTKTKMRTLLSGVLSALSATRAPRKR